MSGSFCVSITAAMGMPKLDAGPQKSVYRRCGQRLLQCPNVHPDSRPRSSPKLPHTTTASSLTMGITHESSRNNPRPDSPLSAY